VISADVATVLAHWRPASLRPDVADFAQRALTRAEPKSPARAKALLFAAGKLGTFATSVGLELVPETVLGPSLIERYIVTAGAALGPATRRTLRSNLRNLSAASITNAPPAPVPLSRERAKAPYGPAQIEAYLALADAQPTPARRQRLSGLVALGAGAGLMGADLRAVRGSDVVARSGGVIVGVAGGRPRVVPVLARYHDRVLAAAHFAGTGYVIGGYSGDRGVLGVAAQRDERPGGFLGRWAGPARARRLSAAGDVAHLVCPDDRAQRVHGRGGHCLHPAPGRPGGRAGPAR
jgi:integrase